MKWIPIVGIFLAKWPIPGKQWTLWFCYQVSSLGLSTLALCILICRYFGWL